MAREDRPGMVGWLRGMLLMQFAVSVMNSGCYEDDADGGETFTFTGLRMHGKQPDLACIITPCKPHQSCYMVHCDLAVPTTLALHSQQPNESRSDTRS